MTSGGSPLGPRAGAGIVLVVLTALVSGVSTFVNVFAAKGTSTDAFVTMRNLLVVVLLVPVALAATGSLRAPMRRIDWVRLAVIGLVGGAIPFLLFFHGLALATAAGGAATATFGYRTLFLMATVLGVVYLGERFHPRLALSAVLLLAGNALLLSWSSAIWNDGTGYVLVATLLWAAEYTLSKRALRDLPSTTVSLGRMGFGALFLVAYLSLTTQWGAVERLSPGQWEWAMVSALLLTAFVTTWYAGLKRVELGVASSALVLGFPITTALGVLYGSTVLTPLQALGATIVVLGVVVAVGVGYLRRARDYVLDLVGARARLAS